MLCQATHESCWVVYAQHCRVSTAMQASVRLYSSRCLYDMCVYALLCAFCTLLLRAVVLFKALRGRYHNASLLRGRGYFLQGLVWPCRRLGVLVDLSLLTASLGTSYCTA